MIFDLGGGVLEIGGRKIDSRTLAPHANGKTTNRSQKGQADARPKLVVNRPP